MKDVSRVLLRSGHAATALLLFPVQLFDMLSICENSKDLGDVNDCLFYVVLTSLLQACFLDTNTFHFSNTCDKVISLLIGMILT